MDCIKSILFLILLAFLSLIVLALLRILDLIKINTEQKIIFLKLNITILAIAPWIYCFLKIYIIHRLFIILSSNFISEKSDKVSHIIAPNNQISWPIYIMVLYTIGFSLMLWKILFSYFHAKNQLRSSHQVFINEQSVFLNKNIKTPFSFGLPKAKIYFPLNVFEVWKTREIQISLAHEKNHVEQNDFLWKLLSLFFASIIVFYPLDILLT